MPVRRGRSKYATSALARAVSRGVAAGWLLAVCATASGASITATVIDRNNTPLNDAVVYAVPGPGATPAKAARSAIIDQINKEFMPYVTPVQTGTYINFPNKDNIRHHVYSFSPAKTFELRLYSGAPSSPVSFDKSGAVVLGCNIHDWMLAYIYVVDTPHFAKTANGSARIDGLPAGDYELKVWHPQLRGPVQTQRIKTGSDDTGNFKFSLDLLPKLPPAGGNPAAKP